MKISEKVKANLSITAFIVLVCAVFIGEIWFSANNDTKELKSNLELINPPQEVVSGQVEDMVITTVVKNDTETKSIVVHFCSGQSWIVPDAQIYIIEKWLKSGLAPQKGCYSSR